MRTSKDTLSGLRRREELLAWLLVSPVVLGLIIFNIYPTLFSLYISLTRWDIVTPPRWIGVGNFVELFTADRHFLQALRNTLVFTLGTVLPGIIFGIAFALLLNQRIRGRFVFRAIYFVPVVVPTVAVAILWSWLYEPKFGVINYALKAIGIAGPAWLRSSQSALTAIMIMSVWAGLGTGIVIFLAGLQSISQDYYEAAEIDGAGALQRLWHITLPLLSPTTFFVLVLSCIGAVQVFGPMYLLPGPSGSTNSLVLYLYSLAFREFRMGLASALAYCVFVVIVILTVINFGLQKKWVFYEE